MPAADSRGGQHLALVDVQHVPVDGDLGIVRRELVCLLPVGRGSESVKDSGLRERKGAHADGHQPPAASVHMAQGVQDLAGELASVRPEARHDDGVCSSDIGQSAWYRERVATRGGHQRRLSADGQPVRRLRARIEDLGRNAEVERQHTVQGQDRDPMLLHGGNLA